jgi:hypothetical protein
VPGAENSWREKKRALEDLTSDPDGECDTDACRTVASTSTLTASVPNVKRGTPLPHASPHSYLSYRTLYVLLHSSAISTLSQTPTRLLTHRTSTPFHFQVLIPRRTSHTYRSIARRRAASSQPLTPLPSSLRASLRPSVPSSADVKHETSLCTPQRATKTTCP